MPVWFLFQRSVVMSRHLLQMLLCLRHATPPVSPIVSGWLCVIMAFNWKEMTQSLAMMVTGLNHLHALVSWQANQPIKIDTYSFHALSAAASLWWEWSHYKHICLPLAVVWWRTKLAKLCSFSNNHYIQLTNCNYQIMSHHISPLLNLLHKNALWQAKSFWNMASLPIFRHKPIFLIFMCNTLW